MANEKQTGEAGRGGSGNFANDPQRASEAGKKGGEHSHGGGSQQRGGSQSEPGGSRNGSGNFANDRDKETKTSRSGPSCGPDSPGARGHFGCRTAPSKDSELSPSHVQPSFLIWNCVFICQSEITRERERINSAHGCPKHSRCGSDAYLGPAIMELRHGFQSVGDR